MGIRELLKERHLARKNRKYIDFTFEKTMKKYLKSERDKRNKAIKKVQYLP
jgi:hypothetical protein